MMKNLLLGLGILFSSLLLSCASNDDIDCSTLDPGPNWFEMGFFDPDGNPLIGTVYTQESFRMFNAQEEFYVSPFTGGDPNYLIVRYDDVTNDKEYYIELSETDTDTLQFTYAVVQGPCFPNYTLENVWYNGELQPATTDLRLRLFKN